MRISDAVRRAITAGDDSRWYEHLANGPAVAELLRVRHSGPDGFDPTLFKHLARNGIANRAQLTHVERADGTWRPFLIPADGAPNDRSARAIGERRA